MIDVDKVLKSMRVDHPANFNKRVLADELRKARSWYQTRSKFDKIGKRKTIIGRFVTDTKRYRVALKEYLEASKNIPLPFRVPTWLNTKALDAVVVDAEADIPRLDQINTQTEAHQKVRVGLGADRGSPMDLLLGSQLPKIFLKCFGIHPTVRDRVRSPDTLFVRFAVEAARQIVGNKTAPAPESVASSYRTMNTPGAGRRRASKPTVQH